MEVEQPRLKMAESDGSSAHYDLVNRKTLRKSVLNAGEDFGHFTLVTAASLCGYEARAAAGGCGVLRVSRADYARVLSRRVERQMTEAVKQLRASPFFGDWTPAALQRLYFMLERRRLQPGYDVCRQGDLADFCFIIASGACDIVVSIPASPETGVARRGKSRTARLRPSPPTA